MAILGPLRELDEVAYLRFASVYRNFSSVADFEAEIADLRTTRAGAVGGRGDTAGEQGTDGSTTTGARAGD
jgi:transcriptional repressor NrdR